MNREKEHESNKSEQGSPHDIHYFGDSDCDKLDESVALGVECVDDGECYYDCCHENDLEYYGIQEYYQYDQSYDQSQSYREYDDENEKGNEKIDKMLITDADNKLQDIRGKADTLLASPLSNINAVL